MDGSVVVYTQGLTENWKLRAFPLEWDESFILRVLETGEGWMELGALCDVHSALMRHGVIEDPVIGKNYEKLEWIEQRSWWYQTAFDAKAPEGGPYSQAVLRLNGLDCEADVFLNGARIAHHRNAFYPFEMDVLGMLRETGNVLAVRLTTGLDRVCDAMMGSCAYSVPVVHENRDDPRRLMLRKPQYAFGWDWSPRAASVGIMGDVCLEWRKKHVISRVSAYTESISGHALLRVTVEAENLHPFSTLDGKATVRVTREGREVCFIERDCLFLSGVNYLDFECVIDKPELWWPNGSGGQPLYDVTASVEAEGCLEEKTVTVGLRTVALDTTAMEGGRRFRFVVNGVPVFCKGGNWVPADTVYGRVTDATLTSLVDKAAEANFNMLRVWGGGMYEREAFYAACDARGILVWQDFMFACGLYPDNVPWLNGEIEKEMEYQTRRLSSHPCIALWCGNNENAWASDEWHKGPEYGSRYAGARIYNQLAPRAVRRNCPHIPYWNSSPYGGAKPNSVDSGDCHYWECMMSPEMERRITPEEFDKASARFVSEYGYLGPCGMGEIKRFFNGGKPDMASPIWAAHTNRNDKGTVITAIRKHYADIWDNDLEGYLLYGGMCQGLMYGYSLEAFRSKPECDGALFWMYNDAWGEMGWSIVDYGGFRKPAYYYVKRAFAPVKLIIKEKDGQVSVTGINETGAERAMSLRFGVMSLDGRDKREECCEVVLPARSREVALSFPLPLYNPEEGFCYAASDDPEVLPAVLRRVEARRLRLAPPEVKVTGKRWVGDDLHLTLSAGNYVHAVHIPGACEDAWFNDMWFDMLPGETREVIWRNAPTEADGLGVAGYCLGV